MSRAYEYYRQDLDDDQKAKIRAERLMKSADASMAQERATKEERIDREAEDEGECLHSCGKGDQYGAQQEEPRDSKAIGPVHYGLIDKPVEEDSVRNSGQVANWRRGHMDDTAHVWA